MYMHIIIRMKYNSMQCTDSSVGSSARGWIALGISEELGWIDDRRLREERGSYSIECTLLFDNALGGEIFTQSKRSLTIDFFSKSPRYQDATSSTMYYLHPNQSLIPSSLVLTIRPVPLFITRIPHDLILLERQEIYAKNQIYLAYTSSLMRTMQGYLPQRRQHGIS